MKKKKKNCSECRSGRDDLTNGYLTLFIRSKRTLRKAQRGCNDIFAEGFPPHLSELLWDRQEIIVAMKKTLPTRMKFTLILITKSYR